MIFLILAASAVLTAHRLRAYFQVTVVEVTVARIAPDGARRTLPTPEGFRRVWAMAKPSRVLPPLERGIREYMRDQPASSNVGLGEHIVWTIRYSYNSTLLDDQRVIVFPAGDGRSSGR